MVFFFRVNCNVAFFFEGESTTYNFDTSHGEPRLSRNNDINTLKYRTPGLSWDILKMTQSTLKLNA